MKYYKENSKIFLEFSRKILKKKQGEGSIISAHNPILQSRQAQQKNNENVTVQENGSAEQTVTVTDGINNMNISAPQTPTSLPQVTKIEPCHIQLVRKI